MADDEKFDRVRRRLLKHAAYVPPMILSLTAMRAHAGRLAPTAGVSSKASANVQVNTHAAAKAQAKIG